MTLDTVREMFMKVMDNQLGCTIFLSNFGNFSGECENSLWCKTLIHCIIFIAHCIAWILLSCQFWSWVFFIVCLCLAPLKYYSFNFPKWLKLEASYEQFLSS